MRAATSRSVRPRSLVAVAALALGTSLLAPQAVAAPADARPDPAVDSRTPEEAAEESGGAPPAGTQMPESASGLYLVRLEEPALAQYRGGVAGLRATSPQATGAERLDVRSSASRAYLDHLAEQQAEATTDISKNLGRDVAAEQTYRHALNGIAVAMAPEEAELVAQLPGVVSVEPDRLWQLDTDVSNEIIGSPAVWGGETGTDVGTRGEGVLVGMIDSGVNAGHPAFAAVYGEGYQHTNPFGAGVYRGVCAPGAARPEAICNDKLVGAYNFTSETSATDSDGHGSHTGSTMAGNTHVAEFTVGSTTWERTVSGVAPRANVISYKVCTSFGCLSSASVAAVNQAIADGTDVLNYSISGPDDPWDNSVDAAFLAAFEAGVFVSASAGNDGPGAGTVAKTAPWNASVAATNNPRLIAHDVSVVAPEPVPADLTGLGGVPGTGPGVSAPIAAEVREASVVAPGNLRGCAEFPAGGFDGAIAVVARGDCYFSVKVDNAAEAGAVAVVVTNQFPGPPIVMGALEGTDVPSVMLAKEEGERLRAFVVAHPGARLRVDSASVLTTTPAWTRMVADFSSRGPSDFDLLAPTYAAPGRNILAATAPVEGDASTYEFMQGTSMAAPHGAGAAALLKALHPDWSPAAIRSALAGTADDADLLKDDGVTAADAYDIGSGLLDLDAAGRVGLVLDETGADFRAADPADGGDPTTLNLPAFVDQNCLVSCTFTRELTSVADVTASYTAEVDAPEGVQVSVEPASFTLEPGATQTVTVTADMSSLVGGEALFGDIAFTTDAVHAGGAEVADVHYPVVLVKAEAEIVLDPTEISTTLGVDETEDHTVTVSNTGGAPMEWSVGQDGDCALPEWVRVEPSSGSVDPGGEGTLTVTFDSADLEGGTYTATLCVASNDPHTPVAQVALALEVVEIPVVEVSTSSLAATQPAGAITSEALTVGNTGYGELDWTVDDPEAGPSDERIQRLRDGVLLVPNSGSSNRGVMAFDPQDGELIDPAFIPHFAYDDGSLYTPNQALPNADGTGFLVADQIQNVVTEYDFDGNFLGFFAPTPEGEDRTILQNIRGMAWSPEGTLVVTVATGANANSLQEFSADGEHLGAYVAPGSDGMVGPWFATFRDDDLLVSANGSRTVHSFSADGTTANPPFATGLNWPEQLSVTPEGNVLVANWSTSSTTLPAGIHEYTAAGERVGHYTAPGSSYAGVHPLGNGNILATTSSGVYEIDRAGAVVDQEQTGGRGRFISEARLPDLMSCQTPAEIGWVSVTPSSGSVARGEADEVEVRFDSRGVAPGTHTAQLCVSSDDPATPYVPVEVSLTVTDQTCSSLLEGRHEGSLVVTEGLACLAPGSVVGGPLTVRAGGAVFADGPSVFGTLSGTRAAGVQVSDSLVAATVRLERGTGVVTLDGNTVWGPVVLDRNSTGGTPIVVAENSITGPLRCTGNTPPPTDDDRPNEVSGPRTGQCAGL